MFDILHRSGIDQHKSLISRIIFNRPLGQFKNYEIKVAAGDFVTINCSEEQPFYIVSEGSLRRFERNFSLLEVIQLDGCGQALALCPSTIVKIPKFLASEVRQQLQNLSMEFYKCLNRIIHHGLNHFQMDGCFKLNRHTTGQRLFVENEKGHRLFILLEGSCRVSKKVESLTSQQDICIYVHSYVKHYILGQEALYGRCYNFTVAVQSRLCFLIEVDSGKVAAALNALKLAQLQQMHIERHQCCLDIQQKILQFSTSKSKKSKWRGSELEQSSRLSLSSLRKDYHKMTSRYSCRNSRQALSEIAYYFEDNTEKVKFELIKKGFCQVDETQYVNTRKYPVAELLKIVTSKQKLPISTGKQYLVPIMKKMQLRRSINRKVIP